MITDLFSHKIHSSGPEWQDKLVELAAVFAEFDGAPYDRQAIEDRLLSLSPRASLVSRDASKFRDEISAYPAYLGLYHLELIDGIWIFKLGETAKTFLVKEEPNVPAFMLLQLSLFQYPNGMGFAYSSNSGNLRIQANVRNRTLDIIDKNIHLSPFRLICKALICDSIINGINSLHPRVSIPEIFILANDIRANQSVFPSIATVTEILNEARQGLLSPPDKFERRFHILNHTDLIQVTNGWIHLRDAVSPEDSRDMLRKLDAINSIENQFNGFDNAINEIDLKEIVFNNSWGKYFDGVTNINSETVRILTNQEFDAHLQNNLVLEAAAGDYSRSQFKYSLRERDEYQQPTNRNYRDRTVADPEVTRIKRQRSNLLHKIITQKVDEHLRNIGLVPYENEHIDLFTQVPNNGSYLFEVKSVSSNNLLSQTRKGLSQLYEYRYRYKDDIGEDVVLCLVYPKEPDEIDWLIEYLCIDREIAVCWFEDDKLCFSSYCRNQMIHLIPA